MYKQSNTSIYKFIGFFLFLTQSIFSGDFPELPEKSNSLKSYIPQKWKILSEADGDLNKDGLSDKVMVIRSDAEDKAKNNSPRHLIILFGIKGGEYKLILNITKPIMKKNEGGSGGDPFSGIYINKGYLLIEHYGGTGNLKWGMTYRYQYKKDDLYLIGKTLYSNKMNSRESLKKDVNLLTGKIIEDSSLASGKRSKKVSKEKRRTLKKLRNFQFYSTDTEAEYKK
jgi:hypothetical protein